MILEEQARARHFLKVGCSSGMNSSSLQECSLAMTAGEAKIARKSCYHAPRFAVCVLFIYAQESLS